MKKYNLVLLTMRSGPDSTRDLQSIAREVEAIDPRIRATVVGKGIWRYLLHGYLWGLPSLSVAMQRAGPRSLLPGRLLTSKILLKSGEYRRLEAAGISVPRWTIVEPDTVLGSNEWGPYVVEKPDFGGQGAYVRIKRTGKVRYKPREAFDEGHFGQKGPMLAQEFIYTGEWPESFRVYTILGKVILCMHQRTVGRGKPLSGRWSFGRDSGTSIVSNTKEMQVELVEDGEIISLCEKAHRLAFSDVPLLGFDVIRDAVSGKLYILECHAHGPLWPFSSSKGIGVQDKNKLDFVSQFDAFRTCAKILAEATPRLAVRRLPFRSVDGRWTAG